MDVTCILFGLLFLVFGILFAMGKLHEIITPWNSLSEEDRNAIAIQPLCVNIGEVIALSGIILFINGIFPGFKSHWLVISMIAWFIIAGFDLWYIEKSRKFKRMSCKKRKGGCHEK